MKDTVLHVGESTIYPLDLKTISSDVASLFEPDFALDEETHVAHRLGSLDQPFSLLIVCEGARCVYRVFYDPGWIKGGIDQVLVQFINSHIASNTEHVRWVFNVIRCTTTKEDGTLDDLWGQVNAVPSQQILLAEFQELSYFEVEGKNCNMFLVCLLDGKRYYLVGIDDYILFPYRSIRHKLRFEWIDRGEQKPAAIRVLYQETHEILALFSPLAVFEISVEDYTTLIKKWGSIWGKKVGVTTYLYEPRKK